MRHLRLGIPKSSNTSHKQHQIQHMQHNTLSRGRVTLPYMYNRRYQFFTNLWICLAQKSRAWFTLRSYRNTFTNTLGHIATENQVGLAGVITYVSPVEASATRIKIESSDQCSF